MKLVLATGNRGKVREFQEALADSGLELVSAGELGLTDFPAETGETYLANALIKARYLATASGHLALADDSGLELAALAGAPGVHSARFGGDVSDAARIAYLLEQLSQADSPERSAQFVCSLVLAKPDGSFRDFSATCPGRILDVPRGAAGFGYDPIFWSEELHKSFAEATLEEKRRVSHRGRALRLLLDWLSSEDGQRFFS